MKFHLLRTIDSGTLGVTKVAHGGNIMLRYRLRQAKIREALAEHHLSITDAAQKLKVSRSYLSQLIGGARCPSPRLRRRMLRIAPFKLLEPDELWERLEDEDRD